MEQYLSVPILPQVDEYLRPHLGVLKEIYSKQGKESLYKVNVPAVVAYAKQRVESNHEFHYTSIYMSCNLTNYERAMIYHWLHDNLGGGARTLRGKIKWVGTTVSAHAFTVYTCGV